jgi:hypothetical protein
MLNQGEERWLTYAEAAELLGISSEAVRQRARRYKWPRRTPNEHGAVAKVLVPDAERGTDRPSPALNGGQPADNRGTAERQPPGHERVDSAELVRRTVDLMMGPIREQLTRAEQRAERAEQEAAKLRAEVVELRVSERIADRAAGEAVELRKQVDDLRAELDARKQWGLRRRLRWALRGGR